MKSLKKSNLSAITGGSCGTDAAAAVGSAAAVGAACASGIGTAGCVGAAVSAAAAAVAANDSCTAATAAAPGSISCTADTDAMGNATGSVSCDGGGGGGCFLEGTQVKMADGSSKSIEHIQTGDLIIEALSGQAVRVTGLKTIMHNKNHWIFALDDSTTPYMTECHPWYDEHNQLCAMSDLAERLAPWLGPIKIVEVQNKIKLPQSVPVYNLMLEQGESHYANDVPVSNIVKNGGAWVLFLKGYIDNEVYCDIARNPENQQFDPVFQTRFFNAVNSLSDFVAKNDNICGHAVGKMMAHGFRNRHRIEPLLRKWVNSPIRRKVFARANA